MNTNSSAQEDLIAIDVLLEPGPRMLAEAARWNAAMREQIPEGFSLDEAHAPHITLVQQFITRSDLSPMLAALEDVRARFDVAVLQLTATGLHHVAIAGIGLAGIVVQSSEPLLGLQGRVIEGVGRFARTGGGEGAFVSDPSGMPFDPRLFAFVETYVQRRSGEHFNPHLTVGMAPLDWLEDQEAKPFDRFNFDIIRIAAYQLGNFGTASRRLDRDC